MSDMNMKNMLCNLGVFDIPVIQKQPDFEVDLLDSNVIVFGSSMSGKSTFLKTLMNILHKRYHEKNEQIFVLDFGGGLSEYQEMPLVAAYFDNSNEEYVKRVFKILDNILKSNIKELNGKNFRDAQKQPIHTTFIIDNLNAFLDEPRYGTYHDKLAKLCRDGLSKGISIVVTASDTKGTSSLMGAFKQKVAFELPADKYSELFNGKVDQIGNNPGHGFANVTVKIPHVTGAFRMNLPYEVQCRFPYGEKESDRADTAEEFKRNLQKKFGFADGKYLRCVQKYRTFPKELTVEAYEALRQTPPKESGKSGSAISVGLDYVDFYPVTVDPKESSVIAIYGKKEFGKTNLLRLLLQGVLRQEENARLVFLDDGRNQLRGFYDKYRGHVDCVYFNGFEERTLKVTSGKQASVAAKPAPAKAPVPVSSAVLEKVAKPAPVSGSSGLQGAVSNEQVLKRKMSPLQQFCLYLNEEYLELSESFLVNLFYTEKRDTTLHPPKYEYKQTPFTVFVIQSKLAYLNTREGKYFLETILPRMASVAEDNKYLFIFSDVQKINEGDSVSVFNNSIHTAFLLDNIAEFAGERGQKSVFGGMDIKTLKEDYARCELGDGYCYDIEADRLVKVKYIKTEED